MAGRVQHPGAAEFLPSDPADLDVLADAVQDCRGCDLYARATQAVFGQGGPRARLVLVGEQPGDVEDREGEPFVGPAGRVLNQALADAGIERAQVYLTNAVKHFRWKPAPSGKRRLHETPTRGEVLACRPWLEAEVARVDARVVVALGAIAVNSLFDSSVRLTSSRGQKLQWNGHIAVATLHPSAVLRAPDSAARDETFRGIVKDLTFAAELAAR
jgi:DNA polymerase